MGFLHSNPNTFVFKELVVSSDYPSDTGYLLTDKVINNKIHTKGLYMGDDLIPQLRCSIVFNANNGILDVKKSFNMSQSDYNGVGLFGFHFGDNKPADAYYIVNCNGTWYNSQSYSHILQFSVFDKSTSFFNVKSYRVDNNTSDNHNDASGLSYISVFW